MSDANGARWAQLFADLEAHAEALDVAERAGEVDVRTRSEIGLLGVRDRLRAAVGTSLRLAVAGGPPGVALRGTLRRVGPDWLLLADDDAETVVALRHLLLVRGLGRLSAVPNSPGAVESRLTLRHALRGLARDRARVRLQVVGAQSDLVLDATIDRVGADFVEVATLRVGETRRPKEVLEVELVQLSAVAAVRRLR